VAFTFDVPNPRKLPFGSFLAILLVLSNDKLGEVRSNVDDVPLTTDLIYSGYFSIAVAIGFYM
jgi:hypothetical protein